MKIGSTQLGFLKALAGSPYSESCGWVWGGHVTSERLGNQLVAKGLATVADEVTEHRTRKVWRISQAGKDLLASGVTAKPDKRSTQKPCPGCGSTGWRSVDTVCKTCAEKLKFAEMVRSREGEIDLAWYDQSIPDGTSTSCSRPAFDSWRKAFNALIRACSIEVPSASALLTYTPANRTYYGPDYKGRFNHRVACCLAELWAATEPMLRETAKIANDSGRNALLALAGGEITVGDFNERAIEQKG